MEPLRKTSLKVLLLYSSLEPKFQQKVEETVSRALENNYTHEVRDMRTLTISDEERFMNDIRMIPSQIRGRVKSGGGRTLPFSNLGNLNRSIPILIFYDGPKPVDVYPKEIKGIVPDLESVFKETGAIPVLGVEDCIFTLLSSSPQILGDELKLANTEFRTGSGIADLVFKDSNGLYMIVEVKDTADQDAVGQILKQSNGMKNQLGLTKIRTAIVALRTSGNVLDACQAAGVELYLISATKLPRQK